MVTEEYRIAITETLDILNHTRKEDVNKISTKFMNYLKNNASETYKPSLDHSKSIKDMQLKEKTRVILAIIYRKFWCNEEQKKEFDQQIKNSELRHQAELREKYNPDNLFKKQEQLKNIEDVMKNEVAMTEYKESIFKKFINKMKSIFNIK